MPRVTIHLGGPEPIGTTINKATPMGLLGTDAIVHAGQLIITGSATACVGADSPRPEAMRR